MRTMSDGNVATSGQDPIHFRGRSQWVVNYIFLRYTCKCGMAENINLQHNILVAWIFWFHVLILKGHFHYIWKTCSSFVWGFVVLCACVCARCFCCACVVCLFVVGPILDDRLKEKLLKPWKGALSSHSVCLCVRPSVRPLPRYRTHLLT